MEENTLQPSAEGEKKPQKTKSSAKKDTSKKNTAKKTATKKTTTKKETAKKTTAKKETAKKTATKKTTAKKETDKKTTAKRETSKKTTAKKETTKKTTTKKETAKKTTAKKTTTKKETAKKTTAKKETANNITFKDENESYRFEINTNYNKFSIEKLINAYDEVSNNYDWLKRHQELILINELFEKKFKIEVEKQKKIFKKDGGNEIDFYFKPEYKKQFDKLKYDYRKKRRDHFKNQEEVQKVNLERKKAIIEEIKSLIDQNQINSQTYKKFRKLQESWYNTGHVNRNQSQNIWETFKHHVERFYGFIHLDREFRELDFKHNYQEKLKIIERAESLQDYPDIIKATRDLNTLHLQWKNDLGPVGKEHSEDLWIRFQKATKIIQKRKQEYQKNITGIMRENLKKKDTLLNEMNLLLNEEIKSHNEWQNSLIKFNSLRERFKSIGYVPAKESRGSWKKFREIGTEFMRKKNKFYKDQKKEFNENIKSKKELISRSKLILEMENLESQVNEMKDIQKEWKTIGFVPRKLDNKLWKEFSNTHRDFFDRIKSGYKKLSQQQENLIKEKNQFLEKLKIKEIKSDSKVIKDEFDDNWDEWQKLGTLNIKNESKLNQLFSKLFIDKIKNLKIEKKLSQELITYFTSKILENDPMSLEKEFQNSKTILSNLKSELTQLENNLEFFTNSSSENPLFKNVEKQIENCQNKIEKAQDHHVFLKQLKNIQIKKSEVNDPENLDDKQETVSESN